MNTEWLNLRPLSGDVKNGFEELVCQLARNEKIANQKKFIRVAAPDGGVESYWVLNNGDEYGWQAKYFTSMDDAQWAQLTKSFTTALDKHPRLVKYFICVPLDRADPRIPDKNFFMDKWNTKVAQWKKIASDQGRTVEFEYWGSFELLNLLGQPENQGKFYFWFNKEEFTDKWFNDKLEESKLSLDKRYTPEHHVDLPISKIFDGIARDNYLKKQIIDVYRNLAKTLRNVISIEKDEDSTELLEKIEALSISIKERFNSIDYTASTPINTDKMIQELTECMDHCNNLRYVFHQLDHESKREREEKGQYVSPASKYGRQVSYCNKVSDAIYDTIDFLEHPTLILANKPVMILSGEAGIGKSHLLADIADRRKKRKQYSLLLLGQHFSTTQDPWTQVKKLLQIDCTKEILLGALNTKAETTDSRLVIFIDAINEGEGKNVWKDHIHSFINTVSKYPRIGLVFSVRSSYEKLLIASIIYSSKSALKVDHYGFANHEYDATKLYFKNYNIKEPSIPLLHPEFSNPLFLRLFCEGLQKKGLQEIPPGYEGISEVINFFLGTINEKLSEKYDIPLELKVVQNIVQKIAEEIMEANNSYLTFDTAFHIVTNHKITAAIKNKSQFFQDIISEGVLTKNLYYNNGTSFDGVYISYERFSDHLIAKNFIEKFLNKEKPKKAFLDDSKFVKSLKKFSEKLGKRFEPRKLFELVKTEDSTDDNRGIVEALCIQLPEITGKELFELAPHTKNFHSVIYGTMDSIIWRQPNTITEQTKEYLITVASSNNHYGNYFLGIILQNSANPKNYFNADYLYNSLWKLSMAKRDAMWLPYIHGKYPGSDYKPSHIKRIINWSWNDDVKNHVSSESIKLLSQTVIWFLASSDRVLRDASTKALVCLLENRIPVLIELLNKFKDVNDPYISQRIYAIALGCAVRTEDKNSLKDLAECIYDNIFSEENVTPDILLRDYARETIEYASFRGHKFAFDIEVTKPPYKSLLPDSFPENEEVDLYEFEYGNKDYKDHYRSQNRILNSMVTEYGRSRSYGDFGRYVFQSAMRNWRVDENEWSNLAVKWIFEKYGYDVNKHGPIDVNIENSGRHDHKNERIGKKYQWIAFYEILAVIADNYEFFENSYSEDAEALSYEGPWYPYIRDIDPTIVMKDNPQNKGKKFWWFPVNYRIAEVPNAEWIFDRQDIPNLQDIISITDSDGTEWLVLESSPEWIDPLAEDDDEYSTPRKKFNYFLSSHIVQKDEKQQIIDYLSNRSIRGSGLTEVDTRYQLFSREFYWSEANKFFTDSWTDLYRSGPPHTYVGKIYKTAIDYSWSEEYDFSKSERISFFKPTELLFDILDLEYGKQEGYFVNNNNEIICFDPNSSSGTISSLIVRKKELIDALNKNNLDIIWSSLGEKLIFGGDFRKDWVGNLEISDIIYLDDTQNLSQVSFIEENR
ncbi:NACHT domain-containing protein [Chryseobacterium limigenitum]|uniref:ATP-binding protein n=1 Tax=Chryseobacterium limigenitum TaxID=1612149 RepID=A0A1K2ILH0_9FLAO|nr:hypothetical protein [Chryseobacterium limigenitum]SFZ93150.1 hypothetical protein SAMN05216324_104175 [Chryseobacterium limigenitum]